MQRQQTLVRKNALPLIVAAAAIVCASFSEILNPWLRFDRAALATGELWRIFTAHVTHLGWSHLGLNLAGLALIWALFRHELTTPRWSATLAASAVGVSAGLWLFNSEVEWYVGLSGVLHGLFIAGVIASLRNGHRREWLLMFVMVGKIISEQFIGPSPGSEELAGGPVIVDAHLYGALSGAVVSLVFYLIDAAGNRKRQRRHEVL